MYICTICANSVTRRRTEIASRSSTKPRPQLYLLRYTSHCVASCYQLLLSSSCYAALPLLSCRSLDLIYNPCYSVPSSCTFNLVLLICVLVSCQICALRPELVSASQGAQVCRCVIAGRKAVAQVLREAYSNQYMVRKFALLQRNVDLLYLLLRVVGR